MQVAVLNERRFEPATQWRWWSTAIVMVFIMVASTFASIVVYMMPLSGKLNDEEIASGLIPDPGAAWVVASVIVMQLITILLVIPFARAPAGGWRARLHLSGATMDRSAFKACGIVGIATFLVCWAIALASPETANTDSQWLGSLIRDPGVRTATILAAVVGAPISEEMLFRGFFIPPLAKARFGFSGAAIISSGLFASIHGYSWPGTFSVFLMGLAFSYMLWRTNSLWPGIVLHAIFNAVFTASVLAW
jgi:membrane protease YdiL (CAAX protease family)